MSGLARSAELISIDPWLGGPFGFRWGKPTGPDLDSHPSNYTDPRYFPSRAVSGSRQTRYSTNETIFYVTSTYSTIPQAIAAPCCSFLWNRLLYIASLFMSLIVTSVSNFIRSVSRSPPDAQHITSPSPKEQPRQLNQFLSKSLLLSFFFFWKDSLDSNFGAWVKIEQDTLDHFQACLQLYHLQVKSLIHIGLFVSFFVSLEKVCSHWQRMIVMRSNSQCCVIASLLLTH